VERKKAIRFIHDYEWGFGIWNQDEYGKARLTRKLPELLEERLEEETDDGNV